MGVRLGNNVVGWEQLMPTVRAKITSTVVDHDTKLITSQYACKVVPQPNVTSLARV
jgi:hypothetical protein